ncbi:RluA family pseudouridine synthase [archaeon]|nr:RluA family pseudouridine synthase [archaeon]
MQGTWFMVKTGMAENTEYAVKVLYEDNHLLFLNKPAGLLTQPSGKNADNMEDRAKDYIRESRQKPGKVFLHAVHRLDKVVSGITAFALTEKALSRMNEQMRRNEIKKTYHAVITGTLPDETGTLAHYLRHSSMKAVIVDEGLPGAKLSRLGYRTIDCTGELVLLEIILETGRYHQIRAQLSASGCPVLGDVLYGGRKITGYSGIALHNREMQFTHPVRKTPLRILADYPTSWPVAVPVENHI